MDLFSHYGTLIQEAIKSKDLSAYDKLLLMLFEEHGGVVVASKAELAASIGVHEHTIMRSANRLEERGYIQRSRSRNERGEFAAVEYMVKEE